MTLRLRFDPAQPHQQAAVTAVIDVLAGQPFVPVTEAFADGVVGNMLQLPPAVLLANLQAVQRRGSLPVDAELPVLDPPGDAAHRQGHAFPNLSVEMETGTGKTYVYLRTALELARRFGLRKFVIVVPSVAVREGVLKTIAITREHFSALLPDVPYRAFAYDGARLPRLRAFADGADVDFMVITIDAFNRASNLVRRPHDAFGGRIPLDVLRATRPVLVLDEPQNLESELSRQSLAELDPCLCLRYSATHRRAYGLTHRLSPRQAQQAGLVKRIEVAEPEAIDDPVARARARLHTTVAAHLARQVQLRSRGIKVLSLIFLERVDDYAGPQPWVREAFDEAFTALRGLDPALAHTPAAHVRAAYFAPRPGRSGGFVDSRTGTAAGDREAYVLIMRDKERLLSLHEPVSFLFSHTALREGWDNPNVFQICTLGAPRSARRRRQEIGRGLRLCVDDSGARVRDRAIDVLTVIADESYEAFVAGLVAEQAEDLPAELAAPVPTRRGAAPPAPVGIEAGSAPDVVPADVLARARAHLQAYAPESVAPMQGLGSSPIDRVLTDLAHGVPALALSRATIGELLIEHVAQLQRDFDGTCRRVAEALRHALARGAR